MVGPVFGDGVNVLGGAYIVAKLIDITYITEIIQVPIVLWIGPMAAGWDDPPWPWIAGGSHLIAKFCDVEGRLATDFVEDEMEVAH